MAEPIPILVSRCLLGVACRYHGRQLAPHCRIRRLLAGGRYVVTDVCPEVDAGLPVPRPPTRLVAGRLMCDGRDVTAAFEHGARLALVAAQAAGCVRAYLVRGSPSCDPVAGVTGRTLARAGILVRAV
jgi:purine-nucleoside phosphorylase